MVLNRIRFSRESRERINILIILSFQLQMKSRERGGDAKLNNYKPGLKTSMENGMFWSEIGSGFGEWGGILLPRILRSTPPPKGFDLQIVLKTGTLPRVLKFPTVFEMLKPSC